MFDYDTPVRTREMIEKEKEHVEKHINSEITTYTLSPEEIEKRYGKVKTDTKEKAPVIPDHLWAKNEDGKSIRLSVELMKEEIEKGLDLKAVSEKYRDNGIVGRLFGLALKDIREEKTMYNLIKKDVENGLAKEELYGKYDISNHIISRHYNKAEEELIAELEGTEINNTSMECDKDIDDFEKVEKVSSGTIVDVAKVDKQIEKETPIEDTGKELEEEKVLNNTKLLDIVKMDLKGQILNYKIEGEEISLVGSKNTAIRIDKDAIPELIQELKELKQII